MLVSSLSAVAVRVATTESDVLAARRLHGWRYLHEGYVARLSPDGTIDDDYVGRSVYLLAEHPRTGALVGTCRLITSDRHRFPMLDHMTLDDGWGDLLRTTPSPQMAEVSGLATCHSDLAHFSISAALCREAFRLAVTERDWKYLLCVVDARLLRALNSLFRIGLRAAGPTQQYMGDTLPTVFSVDDYVVRTRRQPTAIDRYFTDGLDLDELADAIIDIRGPEPRILRPEP